MSFECSTLVKGKQKQSVFGELSKRIRGDLTLGILIDGLLLKLIEPDVAEITTINFKK